MLPKRNTIPNVTIFNILNFKTIYVYKSLKMKITELLLNRNKLSLTGSNMKGRLLVSLN